MNTEISLPVAELKQALPGLNKIIAKRSSLPVLQSIRIARDGQGRVTLQATNLDSYAAYQLVSPQSGPPLELLIPAESLNKTVKSSTTKDVLCLIPDSADKARLRYQISGNVVEQAIPTLPCAEWPATPKITQPPISLDKTFGRFLKEALSCCSEDQSRYVLRGACLDVADAKSHYIVSSNGQVLYTANSFGFDFKKSVIIPDSKFLSESNLLEGEGCSLSVQPARTRKEAGWIQLQTLRWTFIAREIEGQFPDWKPNVHIPDNHWTRVKLSETAVEHLLKVIPQIPGDYPPNHPIRFRVTTSGSFLEGRNRDDQDWTSIPIKGVGVTGNPVAVLLNRHYLLQALKFGLNELDIEDEKSPPIFSKDGRKLIVMPIRLLDPVKPVEAPPPTPAPSETTERKTIMPPNDRPPTNLPPEPASSAFADAIAMVESVKVNLREVLGELNRLTSLLKLAEKEKRSTEKEVASVRQTIRSLQGVKI